jgi:pyruvoyl-dependent arginine decarboxylase (PvlArgDC)
MNKESRTIRDLISALDSAASFAEALRTAISHQDKEGIIMEYVEMLKQIAEVDRLTKDLAKEIEQ